MHYLGQTCCHNHSVKANNNLRQHQMLVVRKAKLLHKSHTVIYPDIYQVVKVFQKWKANSSLMKNTPTKMW